MAIQRKPKAPQHTFLAIRINDHSARVSAGINMHLYGSMRYGIDENGPVYTFGTLLRLHGTCTYPDNRAGACYEITLIGEQATPDHLRSKVKDLHERDKEGVPRYKTYRGARLPIYAEPPGLAFLEKVYGEQRWTGWAHVTPQMITDSLLLLSDSKPAFISIHEKKIGRVRHVQALSVQTTDPAED